MTVCFSYAVWEIGDSWMDTEHERSGGNVAETEVQRSEVHEGNVRSWLHSRSNRRGLTDAGRQCHATTGHAVVTVYRTVPQLRTELGKGVVPHQRSTRSTNQFCAFYLDFSGSQREPRKLFVIQSIWPITGNLMYVTTNCTLHSIFV